MTTQRTGIAAAGNWIVDHVKIIDFWPQQDTLANILAISHGNGGSPYNVLKDIAILGAPFPLEAIGLIGRDADGEEILDDCRAHSIATAQLKMTDAAPTSFTDVMTMKSNGRRTFFHHRGANALFDIEHADLAATRARIFHLGYLLLLDRLDAPHDGHGTRAAALLAQAQSLGLKTSVDVVSEDSQRFPQIVRPALKHADYAILNELEAERTTGIATREGGAISYERLKDAARELLRLGVSEWVVIHFPEGAFAASSGGGGHFHPSLKLPPEFIAGTAGAGDAFCAGVLYGLHESWPMEKSLRLGVCAAAGSLNHPTCSEGMRPLAETLALADRFGFNADIGADHAP
jgi:sugar/nucleoside kinase (ribokinase family)